MEATKKHRECQEKTGRIQDRIDVFFERHTVGTLLNRSGIHKVRGTSPLVIVKSIFGLPFYGMNLFRGIVQNTEVEFFKDAAYDLLNGSRYNWRKFLLWLSSKVTGYITSLTDDDRGITKATDKRSCGYKRRQEAMIKSTELLEPMVKRIVRFGIRAQYILMDSWFGLPKTISTLSMYIPVICMVKNMYRVFYRYDGKKLTLDGLYRRVKKRPGKAKIKASVIVTMSTGERVKIVFVRDRRGKGWLYYRPIVLFRMKK